MAHKMRKFSEGGALGKYNRRMADIKKDFAKDSAGKSGRALEVLEAKRAQRIADAEDDRAKRMGTDRTATRKAEYDAEKNLSRTRRFGADKPVAKAEPAKASAPIAAATPEAAKAKPKSTREEFNAAFSAARAKAIKEGRDPNKETFMFGGKKKVALMAGAGASSSRTNTGAGASSLSTNNSAGASKADTPKVNYRNINFGKPSTSGAATGSNTDTGTTAILQAARVAREKKEAEERKKRIGMPAYERMAKGGKVKKEKTMKYAKGGSTPPQPTPADRARSKKQLDELKKLKPTDKEGKVVGSANRSEGPGYKKGGKMATKFGAAMKKKSADTKGRAMMKFAKGGSIDGCAVKGKTKTSMIKMKNGGSC
jgi:hypothetical protein